jgi:hypothetical protein
LSQSGVIYLLGLQWLYDEANIAENHSGFLKVRSSEMDQDHLKDHYKIERRRDFQQILPAPHPMRAL